MAYTTESKVENYLGIDIDSSLSSIVSTWINAIETWINRYTGKTFEAESATKYYDLEGGRIACVDSFVGSPTEVSILNDDGTVDSTLAEGQGEDYITYPLNETEKQEIYLVNSVFPAGKRRLKVTASFGVAETVPEDVELAATMLLARILEKGIDGGRVSSRRIGDIGVNYQTIDEVADSMGIKNILDQYRDIQI